MLPEASPVTQALLGTLMTWGLTAAGAATALFIQGNKARSKLNHDLLYCSTLCNVVQCRDALFDSSDLYYFCPPNIWQPALCEVSGDLARSWK